LTDGSILHAVLDTVDVRDNAYLGVHAYTVERLIIISNEFSNEFLEAFDDPAIHAHLDPRWPASFPLGMSTFDANLLCVFNGWKVQRFAPLLLAMFGL